MKNYKLVIFVPVVDAEKIRQVLGEAGAGKISNYDFVSFSTRGIGRFRSLVGAKPAIGQVGKLEEVEEERIEVMVNEADLQEVIARLRAAHPYEEPAIDVYELR